MAKDAKANAYQDVFERVEKKYLLTEEQYTALRGALEGRMTMDRYGVHTICNLYYDTDDYTLIRRSLEKPIYKEKLRLRSYGVPREDSTVFLEIKKKFRGVVYKRRIPLTLTEAMRYTRRGEKPREDSQILREIDWFMNLYRPSPKVFIAYNRAALFGNEDENLRVTFDGAMRWRSGALDLSKGDWGSPLGDARRILMEIKIPGTMPLWMCRLLAENAVFPVSFSKYGFCYQTYLLHQKEGVLCA